MSKEWTSLNTRRLRYLAITTEMTDAEIAIALGFSIGVVREHAKLHEITLTREVVVKTTAQARHTKRDIPSEVRSNLSSGTQEVRVAQAWLRREIEMGRMEIEAEFGRVDFERIKQMQAQR